MPTVYFEESTTGEYELVSAPTGGKQIVILGMVVMGEGDTRVALLSDAGGTMLTRVRIVDGGGVAWFFRDSSLACIPGEPLYLDLPDATRVYGHIEYAIK